MIWIKKKKRSKPASPSLIGFVFFWFSDIIYSVYMNDDDDIIVVARTLVVPWNALRTDTDGSIILLFFFFGNTVYARVRRVCIGTTTRIVCVYTTRTGMTFAFHRVWCIRIYTKTVTGGYTNDAIYIITHTPMIRARSEHCSTPMVSRGIIDFFWFFFHNYSWSVFLCAFTRRVSLRFERSSVCRYYNRSYVLRSVLPLNAVGSRQCRGGV